MELNQNGKNSLIRSQKYDVVVYGHTHKIQNTTVGKTLVLNPEEEQQKVGSLDIMQLWQYLTLKQEQLNLLTYN